MLASVTVPFSKRNPAVYLLLVSSLLAGVARADEVVIFRGKVIRDDGSPPGRIVTVQRMCEGYEEPIREGVASGKTGAYFVRLNVDAFGLAYGNAGLMGLAPCYLEAVDPGFVSSHIDLTDRSIMRNPFLPPITLTPKTRTTALTEARDPSVPRAASRNWALALKQAAAKNWAAAETPMRAVVEAAPQFAAGWSALGMLYSNEGKLEEARQAYQRAIELDPKPLSPYLALAGIQSDLKDYPASLATCKALIAADRKHEYVEAHMLSAIALYQSRDFDNALAAINEAIRLDRLRQLSKAEYVRGLIFEAKGDLSAAREHLTMYLQQHPHAKDLAAVNDRLANLGKAPLAEVSSELTALDLRGAAAGEAPVPGGIKAFSAVAQLKGEPSYQDFFLEYCRALDDDGPTREAGEEVRAFLSAVAAFEALGEHRDEGTLVRLSLDGDERIRKTRDILAEGGWKLIAKGDAFTIEPGDRSNDGLKQWALVCLGVDELAMRQAIQQKREFTFEIPRENARLVGGSAWAVLIKGVPDFTGGPIEFFTKDWRFAKVYSGLGAMDADAASAVVSAITLNNLIVKYSRVTADYAAAVTLSGQHVAVPGGPRAEAVWARLAGVNQQNPANFLRMLFDKDQGRLLSFYYDLSHADEARQQYFTANAARAEAFYNWYRDSIPAPAQTRPPERWQAAILQKVVDASGQVRFPGGPAAWGARSADSDEILLHRAPLEALVAISELEEKRGIPLSQGAAQLLADHFNQWRNLFPYLEKLPQLDEAGFAALAAFADDADKAPGARRNVLLGEWHSLVELAILGRQAGALTDAQAAQAFRRACEAMRSPNPSAEVLEVLRTMTGDAADLDEALPNRLLRLNSTRREAFEEVKRLQKVPRFAGLGSSPDSARTLAALSGTVYAALLDPAYLLVAEDPLLLSKHNFVPPENPLPTVFARSWLHVSSAAPGTNFQGGFQAFAEVARAIRKQRVGPLLPEPEAGAAPSQPEAGPADDAIRSDNLPVPPRDLVFRAGGRVVEVYATVTDSRGRYVDNLDAGQFHVMEEGQSKPVFAFENHTAAVSVALVFDTTGSMVSTLPPLKTAAMQLVDDLRPTDSVAVYSFNDTVNQVQPFTSDKDAAKRAILKTHASGITALYDALVRVNRDLSARGGKKVVIVFTDGRDNASTLQASVAVERAKASGIPIYTIAQGEALENPRLIEELARISQATGGSPFLIHRLGDIAGVFEKVSQDLMHGYLVAFQPTAGKNHEWRKIELLLSGAKGLQVRAREGFYVE